MAKTETINAGENLELNVQELPENLQRLVSIYDETNERLSKAKTDSLIYSAASQWFLNNITAGVDAYLKSQNAETVEESSEELD
jgi:DNA polymerase III gamma/tau subunit